MTRDPDRDPPSSSPPPTFDFLNRPAAELAAPLFAAHASTGPEVRPGELLGPYRIVREVGRGGMATVYLAEDPRHARQVALKVLYADVAAWVGRQRFLQEIQVAARLLHPHILPVFDSGESAGRLWYAMPYVAGETLRHRLAREPRLPIAEAVGIAREVALALDYAHRQGVIHRDIKPGNILLADGQALVADFGIARALRPEPAPDRRDEGGLTETGVALGTPAYMSPEQALGTAEVDARTDIYALGCVLYEMLAGEPPFSGPSAQAIMGKRLSEPVPSIHRLRDGVPESLERVLQQALARDPANRFATAAEFSKAMGQADGGGTVGPLRQQPLRRRGWRRTRTLLGATAGIAALGSVYFLRRGPPGGPPPAPVSAPSPIPLETRSIAVLPLVNVGGDPKDEYFSDGMSDELASALSQVPGLRVASRTSAFTFKGRKDVDIRQIGRQLNVGAVLEGAVLRAGNRLRISTQLISVTDGLTLWSDTYERDLKDIFNVQEEIARATAGALQLTLGDRPGERLASDRTASVEAHDLYLQGRVFFGRYTEPDIRLGLDLFERALTHDSLYVPAYVGISLAWSFLGDDWLAPRDAYPKAERAARRALELDSTFAGAYIALAQPLFWYRWDIAGAERALRRAIALKPDGDALEFYGDYLMFVGRRPEAELELRRALAVNPLSPSPLEALSELALRSRQIDEALAEARKAIPLDPNYALAHQSLADAYRAKGMFTEALGEYSRAEDLGWRAAVTGRALTFAQMGRSAEARHIAQQLESESARRYVSPDKIAVIYARLGDRDAAFRWLERSFEERSMVWAAYKDLPDYDPIRHDPRFSAMLQRMGLTP